MIERVNCLNCGAPLHYDETNYGSTAKCQYCRSEYHIDKLGRVEEFKVKIKMGEKIISFYINTMQYEPVFDRDLTFRDCEGRLSIRPVEPIITLTLTSYEMKDVNE